MTGALYVFGKRNTDHFRLHIEWQFHAHPSLISPFNNRSVHVRTCRRLCSHSHCQHHRLILAVVLASVWLSFWVCMNVCVGGGTAKAPIHTHATHNSE